MVKPKIAKTKEDLKSKVLNYISSYTRSDNPHHFLKKETIISHMLKRFDTTKTELKDIIEELEGEGKIKSGEVNYELFYLKSEENKIKQKLEKEGVKLSFFNQNTIIFISLIITGMIVYFFYKPSSNFQSIAEGNIQGVYVGILFSFFGIILIRSIYFSIKTKIEEKKKIFTKNNLILTIIIFCCFFGVIGLVYDIKFASFAALIIAVLSYFRK